VKQPRQPPGSRPAIESARMARNTMMTVSRILKAIIFDVIAATLIA
jgi:hypothetical protein